MRAMLLESQAKIESAPLRRVDLPDPVPGAGEIRIRVECCAICRTDLHVIEGDLPPQRMPIIPGHQVVGVIDQLGPECRLREVGQRVGIAWLRQTCQACRFCMSGRENLCELQRFTGYHEDGGYAEYALADEAFVYPIPDRFDSVHASPLLCAGIIGYRALERSHLAPGGAIALYGFGSSAHLVLQLAKHRGCAVDVVTRGENHQKLAIQMGARHVARQADDLPDCVGSGILFAPAGELVPPALTKIDKGGTLALAGIHMSDVPAMNYEECLFYEKTLCSVTANTRADGHALLQEAAAIPLEPHVRCYPLEQANQALLDLKEDRISGTGVLVMR
jgi:propanol-preferring alcohol dehydrogenase